MDDSKEDEIDRAELPRDIVDRAIGRWHDATREQAEAYRLAGDVRELERWTGLATDAAIYAGRLLIRAILTMAPGYDVVRMHRAEKRAWSPRGVRSNGRLYLAVPDPGREGTPEDLDGPDVMQLVEVDEKAIVDIEREGRYVSPAERTIREIVERYGADRALRAMAGDEVLIRGPGSAGPGTMDGGAGDARGAPSESTEVPR